MFPSRISEKDYYYSFHREISLCTIFTVQQKRIIKPLKVHFSTAFKPQNNHKNYPVQKLGISF